MKGRRRRPSRFDASVALEVEVARQLAAHPELSNELLRAYVETGSYRESKERVHSTRGGRGVVSRALGTG